MVSTKSTRLLPLVCAGIHIILAAVVACAAEVVLDTNSHSEPPAQISDESPHGITHTELQEIAKKLFKKTKTKQPVIEGLEVLKERGHELFDKLPLDPGTLLEFNLVTADKCENHEYIEEMFTTLHNVKSHHKPLVGFMKDCIERQMDVCQYGIRIIKSIAGYGETAGWKILDKFYRYVRKYGQRLKKPTGFKYLLDVNLFRQALKAMAVKATSGSSSSDSDSSVISGSSSEGSDDDDEDDDDNDGEKEEEEVDEEATGESDVIQGSEKAADEISAALTKSQINYIKSVVAQMEPICDQLISNQLIRLSRLDPSSKSNKKLRGLQRYIGICGEAFKNDYGGVENIEYWA